MKKNVKNSKATIIVCLLIGLLVIGGTVFLSLSKAGIFEPTKEKAGTNTKEEDILLAPTSVSLPKEGDTTDFGLVISLLEDEHSVSIYRPQTDSFVDLFYDGTTDVRNRFGDIISFAQVKAETIVEVSYRREDGQLIYFHEVEPEWSFERQTNVEIIREKGTIVLAGSHYRFGKNVIVHFEEEPLPLSSIMPVDELSVKGMGDRVFMIEQTKGHGTLQLLHATPFLDGIFAIDGKEAETVTGDMRFLVREGEYYFSLEKDALFAGKTLEIPRDGVFVWDLTEFLPTPTPTPTSTPTPTPSPLPLPTNSPQEETTLTDSILTEPTTEENSTDLPQKDADPTPTPTAIPAPTSSPAPTIPVQIIWYPTSVVIADDVYLGNTDEAGLLRAELGYGKHTMELVNILQDGNTKTKRCEVETWKENTVLNLFLVDDLS